MSRIRIAHVTTVDLTLRFLVFAQLQRLRDEGFDVTGISAPGPWTGDLEAEGIRHIPWPHATRAWNPRSDSRAFAELVRILRRERFDLVHTHNPKPGVMGRIAARLTAVPCVVNTVHGLYATPQDRPVKKLAVLGAEWAAGRFGDLELYQSSEDLAWARRIHLVSASRSALLGNGVDLSHFDAAGAPASRVAALRAELGIPAGALVVGAVGRLVIEKGYRELFEAARTVRETVPSARFVVVGDVDAAKSDALPAGEIERAKDTVIFAGWREDVRDILSLVDVFVLASWREGMPRSAIEAAAMGKALVLTDIRGCREVARHDVEALLVRPRDPAALASAITRALGDEALRRRLGEAARSRARERFDERVVADAIVEHYRGLLEAKGVASPATPAGFDPPIRVRPARVTDAAAIARLHRQALPAAFLPTLGERFLRRLYRAMVDDEGSVALVARNGKGVVGFATGAVSVGGFYRRFARSDGVAAAASAAPALLRPGTLRRALETARYPSDARRFPASELLSIAVAPEARSAGIGRALAEGVVAGLAARGADEVKVVVGADNEGANRFYARLGFRQAGRINVHDGTASIVWQVRCHS